MGSGVNAVTNVLADWSQPERSWVVRKVVAPAIFVIASEAMAITAISYQLLAATVKALPATVLLITGSSYRNLNWGSIYRDHLRPLGKGMAAIWKIPIHAIRGDDLALACRTTAGAAWGVALPVVVPDLAISIEEEPSTLSSAALASRRSIQVSEASCHSLTASISSSILLPDELRIDLPLLLDAALPADTMARIEAGDVDFIRGLNCSRAAYSRLLPNSELPLHYAVMKKQYDVVAALLAHDIGVGDRDTNGLMALDHAVLMGDDRMVRTILGCLVGLKDEEMEGLLSRKMTSAAIKKFRRPYDMYISKMFLAVDGIDAVVDSQSLLSQAAHDGDIAEIRQYYSKDEDKANADGYCAIHWAIIGNKIEAVDVLIEQGVVLSEYPGLLNLAIYTGSYNMVKKLIALGVDPNAREGDEPLPLQTAAVLEDLCSVQILIKGGANPRVLNDDGTSLLTAIGVSAHDRDPLAIPKGHWALLAATALAGAAWTVYDWDPLTYSSKEQWLSALALGIITTIGQHYAEYRVAYDAIPPDRKHLESFLRGGQLVPGVASFMHAVGVAWSSTLGVRKTWRYAGNRPWHAVRNFSVYFANAYVAFLKALSCKAALRGQHALFDSLVDAEKGNTISDRLEAFYEYVSKVPYRKNLCLDVLTADQTGYDKILNPRYKADNCPNHALHILDLELEGLTPGKIKTAYRKMQLEYHPDKTDDIRAQQAFMVLADAKRTLVKCLDRGNCGWGLSKLDDIPNPDHIPEDTCPAPAGYL